MIDLHAKICWPYVGFLKFHKYGIHFSSLFIKFDFTFFLHQQLGEHTMSNMQFAPIGVSSVSQSPQSHCHPWQSLDAPSVHRHRIFQRNMLLCRLFFLLFFVSWLCLWFTVYRLPVHIVHIVHRWYRGFWFSCVGAGISCITIPKKSFCDAGSSP